MARPWDKDPATGRTQRALVFTVSRPCPTIARSIGSKLNEWLQYREAHTGRDADPSRRHRRRRFRRPICGAAVAAGTRRGGPRGTVRGKTLPPPSPPPPPPAKVPPPPITPPPRSRSAGGRHG